MRNKTIALGFLFTLLILILFSNHQVLETPLKVSWLFGSYNVSSPSIAYFFFAIYGLIIGAVIER